MPLRLDHVGIAVWDLRPAAGFWGDVLGGELKQGAVEYAGFSYLQYAFGAGRIELLSPARPGAGFIAQFLERHGEGVHHLTFLTDDLHAEVDRLRALGERVLDEDYSNPHWREAFLDAHLGGRRLLVQVGESDIGVEELDRRYNIDPLERVLAAAAARAAGR
jgi:methylmalonyl-CoA/ethylmalonyl-CoA epimerase